MNDKDTLKAELRAVREEIAYRELNNHMVMNPALLSPSVDIKFVRITQLSDEQLEKHEKRLVRDLEDVEIDNPNQLYRPTSHNEHCESEWICQKPGALIWP